MTDKTDSKTPPVGDEVHMPDNSLLPLAVAVGITLSVVGLTTSWYIVGTGVLILILSIARWIKDARKEYRELPPESSH